MLYAYNNAASTVGAGGVIPINTVIAKTNGNAALNGNAVQISKAGWYIAGISAVLSSTDAATVGVQLCAQGNAVAGAVQTVDIAAGGTATVSFEWPVQVIDAASGTAALTWTASAAATVDSVVVGVRMAV